MDILKLSAVEYDLKDEVVEFGMMFASPDLHNMLKKCNPQCRTH